MKTNEKRPLAEVEKEYLGRVWTASIDHEPGLEGFRYWVSERDGTIPRSWKTAVSRKWLSENQGRRRRIETVTMGDHCQTISFSRNPIFSTSIVKWCGTTGFPMEVFRLANDYVAGAHRDLLAMIAKGASSRA